MSQGASLNRFAYSYVEPSQETGKTQTKLKIALVPSDSPILKSESATPSQLLRNAKRRTKANATNEYSIDRISPGSYTVIAVQGDKIVRKDGVLFHEGNSERLDFDMRTAE